MRSPADHELCLTNRERDNNSQLSTPSPQPTARLAYILAASHSGSTLLAMLLGAHPEACTVGELKGASRGSGDTYRCSCGAVIRDCAFWQNVTSKMACRGLSFDVTTAGTSIHDTKDAHVSRLLRPLHRGPVFEWVRDACLSISPGWRPHCRRVQFRNSALVETLLEVSGAKVIVDSSKTGLRLKYLLRNPDLDVRVIRLLRDGRAVSLTHTNPAEFADATNPRLRSGGTGVVRPSFRLSMKDAALLWRHSNEEADHLLSRLNPSQWVEVRYEQLCTNPAETLHRICDFVGISAQEIRTDFRVGKQQHVVGNGMRFDTTSEIRLDERWKTHLTVGDLEVFDRGAGELNRQYGYV